MTTVPASAVPVSGESASPAPAAAESAAAARWVAGRSRGRGLVAEDLLRFRWLDELVLSPDGARVAYSVRRPDVAANGYAVDVFVVEVDSGEAVRVSEGVGSASALAWDRSGARLAFSWSAGGSASVQIWDAAGLQVWPTPGAPFGALTWNRDGRWLAGVRWTDEVLPGDPVARLGLPRPTARVVRRLRYKQDGAGWVHDRFAQVWALRVATGDLLQVTSGQADHAEPAWAERSDALAYVVVAREQDVEEGWGQVLVVDEPGAQPRPLLPGWRGAARSPQWGDGDASVVFVGHDTPAPVNRRMFCQPWIADVARGRARKIAHEVDQEVGNYAVSDSRKGLSNITVKWPVGGRWFYYLVTERGATHLYRADAAGRYERLDDGPHVTFEYAPSAGGRVAVGRADPASPGELYVREEGGAERRLTQLNPWLADHELATPQEHWVAGVDGDLVQGWLLHPPGFDPAQRYPAIEYVHCSMFSWDFSHEQQCLAAAGYVVHFVNQRGTSAGFGQAWTRASEGDQGGRDYEETMLMVDWLVDRPYVDAARLGVTGGSCGGFMTNWIVGHTDRFKAAVTQRSIVNQISFFGTSDIGPEGTTAETGADPWTDLEKVWRQSPLAYADRVTTPLLIIHSDEDHRCPLEQAEQWFAALRWLGKEVEMVVFQGENHGLSRGGRPANRIERLRRIQGWFDDRL